MAEPEAVNPETVEAESVETSAQKPPSLPTPPASKPVPEVVLPPELVHHGMFERARMWITEEGPWWLCSFVFHVVLVCSLALVGGKVVEKFTEEAPSFEEAKVDTPVEAPKEIERFDIGETPEDPTELSTDTLDLEKPAVIAQEAEYNDEKANFEHKGGGVAAVADQPNTGGLGGFDIKGFGAGPAIKGKGGVGIGVGTGTHAGSGGDGSGFGGRGSGSRKAQLGTSGGTKQSERAVAGALNWIARHQLTSNGSWSLTKYSSRCTDATCTGGASAGERPAAATAMALLPFLAAGQTHVSKGPYKHTIAAGVRYLIGSQKPDGDLRLGGTMYDHGLAAIALCECYGMSNDSSVRNAAQASLNFIMAAQDPAGGGWRYGPKEAGDTSVVGWQIMALKSGKMAYLNVNEAVFGKAKAFLKSVSSGAGGSTGGGGLFAYMPAGAATAPMTSVGLLCNQYMGMGRADPAMTEGVKVLMQNLPDAANARNVYYWYYATQVMHNVPGSDWDTWNRKMRRILIDTQCKDKKQCANGSWNPAAPIKDKYGDEGGRLMMTSLSALTLEVYYRYLPLYKLDKDAPGEGGAAK